MSMVLILTDRPCALDTETLARLGDLGVTNLTLLEGPSAAGVLIQGWAFERSSAEEAVQILAFGGDDSRVLEPVMQVSVSAPGGVSAAPRDIESSSEKEQS